MRRYAAGSLSPCRSWVLTLPFPSPRHPPVPGRTARSQPASLRPRRPAQFRPARLGSFGPAPPRTAAGARRHGRPLEAVPLHRYWVVWSCRPHFPLWPLSAAAGKYAAISRATAQARCRASCGNSGAQRRLAVLLRTKDEEPRYVLSQALFLGQGQGSNPGNSLCRGGATTTKERCDGTHHDTGKPGITQRHDVAGQDSSAPTWSRTSCTAQLLPSGSAKNTNLPPSLGSSVWISDASMPASTSFARAAPISGTTSW